MNIFFAKQINRSKSHYNHYNLFVNAELQLVKVSYVDCQKFVLVNIQPGDVYQEQELGQININEFSYEDFMEAIRIVENFDSEKD